MMKIMRQWTAALLCALLALTPVLSFAEGDYDAGELTGTVASVAYQYGQQINLKVNFDGVPSGDSKRAKAISNLLSESELALSFYDDYGTGRIHGVFSLDGMDLLEGTLLLPADGSMQLKTNLTGSTMLTFPAGTLGKSMNWQDVFYGSIVRRRTDVSLEEMSARERLRATTSDMIVLLFNHLLGWTSARQMDREFSIYTEQEEGDEVEKPFYSFDDTLIPATDTRDEVCQRMLGCVYASEFTELMWNIAATTDAEMGDFQTALADCLAEQEVTGLQVHQLADKLMPDIPIDPATDFVTPTHAVPADALCTKKDVSYFLKKLVKYTDKLWEESTDEELTLVVSYDYNGRMVGFEAVLPKFTASLPLEGSYSWSLKTDENGQSMETIHGELQVADSQRLAGDAVVRKGRDVGGVKESSFTAALDLLDQAAQTSAGLGVNMNMRAELGTDETGADTETTTGSANVALRANGENSPVVTMNLDGLTATSDGVSFQAKDEAEIAFGDALTVQVHAAAGTSDPEEISVSGGQALNVAEMDEEDAAALIETMKGKIKGMVPMMMLHPGLLSDLTTLLTN